MKRARCVALAALIGACAWCAPVSAQYGPPGGANESYMMMDAGQWECPPEDAPRTCFGLPSAFDGGFLRGEYLHWNLDNPGNVPLGAPLASTQDTSSPFFVFDPGTSNIIAVATVPTTLPVDLRDVNGVRVVGGLDLVYGGSIEIGAFMLGKKTSGYEVPEFPQEFVVNPGFPLSGHLVTRSVGTSVLTNGQVGNTIFLYNQAFSVQYASQLWGAEGNYIFDHDREGLFWFNPTVGFRYFNLHEKLLQRGVFLEEFAGAQPIVTTIDASTFNNLYGPQIGGRLELVTKYINMGVDPKLMFLANSMSANVITARLRSNDDPITSSPDRTTNFSLGADVGCYAQLNFGPNFSVRVGYNYIWFNSITRPEDNIYYNDNGLDNPPAIATNLTLHNFVVHGVSVGGELRY